ncbi:MAG: hypothetical protein AUH78_01400 [Gemmatimonadetes bacterium 13_1_40CM_4_69_8]|nr:MAG: hypothetical protein AUH78_01400 [Gemmatimonadetes bacterium 13_1_40CM_4_69_8]PYP73659.1 MAG: hypothetical protein DMD41_04950 [Gemmatimonadota bacterium]
MRQLAFALLATWGTTACYYYQPLATPTPTPGSYLSVTLTDTGADHLARTIGPDVRSVRGRLLTSDSGALTFSVVAVSLHHGEDVTWKGEPVTLSRTYVSALQQRRLAKGRTVLIIGATALGFVTTYKVSQGIGLIPTGSGGGGSPK